jgi:hypothetical protein
MLYAIPTTPLYDRLRAAGRLNDEEAREKYGTNVIPLGMSREELRDGCGACCGCVGKTGRRVPNR